MKIAAGGGCTALTGLHAPTQSDSTLRLAAAAAVGFAGMPWFKSRWLPGAP